MAKNIIMQVLTSAGYEPMYPFSPNQILNATFLSTSTSTRYNITITGIPTPLTNSFGNSMGIISFRPTMNNGGNLTLSLNGDTPRPVVYTTGANVVANTFASGRSVLLKYYNGKYYLLLDKNQVGLYNVDNTSDMNKPISTAVQNALNGKLNTPQLIPSNSNLNNYTTPGMYYNPSNNQVATMSNVPIKQAFSLFVQKNAGTTQTFTCYSTNGVQMWVRNYFNGIWGSWTQVEIVLKGTTEPSNNIGLDGNIYIQYE